jgi:hypothetical protein
MIITVITWTGQATNTASKEGRGWLFIAVFPFFFLEVVGGLAGLSLAGDATLTADARYVAGLLGVILCGFCLLQIAVIS